MKKLALLLLLTFTSLFAQEKKYQGLLWEISGNGLKKNSYLYGSMHVSDKVSYHLSDAFFAHLLSADIIANESEPSTWMDIMGLVGNGSNYYRGSSRKFYSGFYLEPSTKNELYQLFRTNNYTLNNLLFRTNENQKEYQEETYLDMFIYRTGRKYNKKTVGLEDTKTSLLNIMNIDYRAMKPREENIATLQKILKNTGYQEALLNYYRDKDLDMLDSLTTLASSESYLKTLLYDRNVVMVHSIDSIIKTGSLFAAVGAAHLPGKRGIIEMLRSRGYKVNPVVDRYTDAGKTKKEKIEEYFIKPTFKSYTTADGIVTLPVFNGSVIESGENMQSPDLANGGYINIKRLLLKDFLKKDNKPFNHQSLDSLFYENIPGKIIQKNFSQTNGVGLYDIKSVTKTGNAQRYRYYITPLEIIMVSMAGEKNYVRQFENEVFNGIKVKTELSGWGSINPAKGGFKADMPAYHAIHGENATAKTLEDVEYYAYDSTDKSNYFVIERTLSDTENLEDTNFELQRMHYEFYNQLGIDSTQTKLTANPAAFTSSSKIGAKSIKLKSVINGPKYYLLGSVGATEANTGRFFNSFTLAPYKEDVAYETYKDTTALYSINIPKSQNAKLEFERNMPEMGDYGDDDENENVFQEKYNTRQFTLPSGGTVEVYYHKYHRHHAVVVDSLWADFKKFITEEDTNNDVVIDDEVVTTIADDETEYNEYASNRESLWDKLIDTKTRKLSIANEKKENKGSYQTYEGSVESSESSQAIKFKALHRNGTSYLISTMTPKGYKNNDPAIEKMFSSFTLLDNSKEENLPADRMQLFIDDARSEYDSIRSSTLKSVNQLQVTKENRVKLQQFIEGFTFKPEETNALTQLYRKLGNLKDKAVIPFFENQYKREDSNTIIQFAVLEALAEFETEEAYKKIKELLEYDLPVTDDNYEVANLFSTFSIDPKNSAVLFPDVFQYYSIPEYHEPVVSFTASLLEADAISPKKLKAYKKMLLTNTRLEIKRAKSRKAGKESGEDEYYYGNSASGNLTGYMELLYPFKSDKEVNAIFTAIKALDIDATNMEIARLDIKNGNTNEQELQALLNNPKTLFEVQKMLIAQKKTAALKNITDEQIAKSALLKLARIDTAKDSVALNEKRVIQHGKNSVSFYFYKVKSIDNEGSGYRQKRERLCAVAFVNNGSRINPQAYKNAGTRFITDDDEIADYKKTMIDAALNARRNRAGYGKRTTGYDATEEYAEEDY
ncbi:TraB/GumN family protein [Flavobacterium zepuense]|uniref:TraB/GumN family protein n=1 Tax=Flavobacterium zepuense TaxID=2593302 RepID=UPI00163D42D9|nr:TraB/GumN family protein [Flavobacterium zepuense]